MVEVVRVMSRKQHEISMILGTWEVGKKTVQKLRTPNMPLFCAQNPAQVLMTVSIQYMQRPVDILREAFRVLKPGGILIVSFSNRMFFTKAIEVWRAQRNMKGLVNLVLNYFREACCECHDLFSLYVFFLFS